MAELPKYAIIVAGGKGLRMNSEVPKQFLPLCGMPVLMHTLNAFYLSVPSIKIILVLPSVHVNTWSELVYEHDYKTPHSVVIGGDSRFSSVKNGLDSLEGEGIVAVHDGVRPLVSPAVILRSFEMAASEGAAITVIPSKDSIRKKVGSGTVSVNRDDYYLVQTPQTFLLSSIRDAYAQAPDSNFTDDASVYEEMGVQVQTLPGNFQNIKITTPEDLKLAEIFIKEGEQ